MKRLFMFIVILVFIFALGCAEEAPAPKEIEAPEPAPAPEMKQVEDVPEEEDVGEPPGTEVSDPESEYKVASEEEDPTPMGSRVEGTEQDAAEEEVSDEDIEEIGLTAEKIMTSSNMTVSVGTTLAWKNYDSWPHQLAVESGSGWDTVRHAESDRLLEGNVWEYTFEEKGTFLVRDIFSGPMRMYVTVE